MSYQDLAAWKRAMDLCDEVYDVTENFPQHEIYGLRAQLRRAAIRVPSCIGEGEGRLTDGERLQFLGYARGSIYEIETQLIVSTHRHYVEPGSAQAAVDKARKALDGYIGHLMNKRDAGLPRPT